MKSTLYLKFVFAYIIFGFLSFYTIATLTSKLIENDLVKQKANALYYEATLLSKDNLSGYYQNTEGYTNIYAILSSLATYQSSEIWWIDTRGEIFINTSEELDQENRETIKGFTTSYFGNSTYQIGTFFDCFDSDTLSVIAPINYNLSTRGYVIFHFPMSTLVKERDTILNVVYITLIAIMIFSLIILLAFSVLVFYPLKKITLGANEFATGNLDYVIPINTQDEIGQLSATMNYMASELSKSEEYQKKFIANISHDFRSPLTSIKGYVEAILDGTIPHEMEDRYLNIVLFETERLNKLTSSLLTLNNMEKKALLDITDFDINTVIRNTSAAFEGTCKAKKVSIELILTGKTLHVSADMGKIQQVLYNLIDNAIKFSYKDSSIYVETTQKHEKIFISVKDTGIGIPRDSLKKVFERFYKTDLSRGKDKRGTGLGLSIAKEIIQAHNENIDVISTEGVGTEFIFTLPCSKFILED